jgi:hypothetical protein
VRGGKDVRTVELTRGRRIRGRVLGLPHGETAEIEVSRGAVRLFVGSDADGRFLTPTLPPGPWTVAASNWSEIGFRSASREVNGDDAGDLTLEGAAPAAEDR